VSGTVYRLASAGIALTNDDPARGRSHNGHADGEEHRSTGPYSEGLIGLVDRASGGFAPPRPAPRDIVAGNTDTTLSVSLSTAQAGTVTGSVTLGLTSDGTGIDGSATLALRPRRSTSAGRSTTTPPPQVWR